MLGLKRQLQGTMICVLLCATITHNTHIQRTGRQKLETCSTFHSGHALRTLKHTSNMHYRYTQRV